MEYKDFKINEFFYTKEGAWLCTDMATKRIIALKRESKSVFNVVYDSPGGKKIKEENSTMSWDEVKNMPERFDEKVFPSESWVACKKDPVDNV